MTKSPEELAEEHANMRCPEQGPEFIVWCMCKDDYLTGYAVAQERAHAALEEAEAKYEEYVTAAEANFKAMEAKIASLTERLADITWEREDENT